MRLVIAGSRSFNDYIKLENTINEFIRSNNIDTDKLEIITGMAKGADILGERYAINHAIRLVRFPAKWDKYGKRAGFLRNEEMAKYAMYDHGTLFVFWDGRSHGTKNMLKQGHKYHLEIHIIKPFKQEEVIKSDQSE